MSESSPEEFGSRVQADADGPLVLDTRHVEGAEEYHSVDGDELADLERTRTPVQRSNP